MTSYAPNGDILAANDSANGNWNYAYDDFNRLCASNQGGQTSLTCTSTNNTGQTAYTYGYDRFGNRWKQTLTAGSGGTSSLTFSGNNNRMDGYSYDADGNVLNDGMHTYTYDAENRIVTVDGGATIYVYDANGQRVRKTLAGASTDYVYDLAAHAVAEVNASGWQRGEVYAGGRHLATYVNSTTYFDHGDWLGTERVRTAVNGSVCESITSLPFGDGMSTTGSCAGASTRHFTGKERDPESGLDNFGARYFASTMGRFMSADPFTVTMGRVVDPQQLNLYAYVRNNPLKHIDPTGMIIDDAACKQDQKHCGKDWQKVQAIINAQDKNGNYLHPELHNIFSTLQSDSRTFVIENSKLPGNEGGVTTITNFTADGQDFTRATLQVDFNKIKAINEVSEPDLVPGFRAFTGLLGAPMDRLAETFGHEGAHGLFAIQNPSEAVGIQQLLNQRNAALQGQHYPYPPDVMMKMDAAKKGLVPTETFAQQEEKIVNGELQADKKKQ